jgi:hypothetical protein
MNATEIVIREVQSDSGFQMRQLLAERIRKPRKSPHRHSHGQVLSFYERRADVSGVGVALSDFGYNPRDAWWGVPRIRAVELAKIAKHLGELGEVHIRAKALGDGHGVMIQPVRCELNAVGDAPIQVPQKRPRIGSHALADAERRNQFSFSINGDVNPLVPNFGSIAATEVPALLSDVSPDFVNLQIPGAESAHSRVHQPGAMFASDQQQSHNGVAVESREPFRAADRAAFQKAGQRPCCGIRAGTHSAERRNRLRFAEGDVTGLAAPTLDAALTEVPKPFAGLVLTLEAGHVISPLAFCEETGQNRFSRSMAWVTPRFGLVPASAETEAGTLSVKGYLARWINGNYHRGTVDSEADCNRDLHCVPPFSCRSVLIALSGLYLHSIDLNFDHLPAVYLSVRSCLRLKFLRYHSLKSGVDGGEGIRCVVGKVKASGQQRLAHFNGGHPILLRPEDVAAALAQGFLNVRSRNLPTIKTPLNFPHHFREVLRGFLGQLRRSFLSSRVEREALKGFLDTSQSTFDLIQPCLQFVAFNAEFLTFVYQSVEVGAKSLNQSVNINVFNHVRSL